MSSNVKMQWMGLEDLPTKVISYAQNQEDILLARAFSHSNGMWLDVGANHPVFHSVTKLFSDRGWRGINIEPSPLVFGELEAERPHDINLNVGVAHGADTLMFYDTPDRHGWSTFRIELANHYREIGVEVVERPIPVVPLAEICDRHVGDRTIDFLKIDAEGFEQHVLLGADFDRWRPRVIVIENAWSVLWEHLILEANYIKAVFDGLNNFYVRAEEPELLPAFASTVNVLDNYIPYEYLRMIEILNYEAGRKFSFINAIRHDGPRVARKVRSVARRLAGGLRAG